MNTGPSDVPKSRTVAIAKRILFVLFEGLPATVIDTQVLLHIDAAQKAFGARFEIWAFCGTRSLYEKSMARQNAAEGMANCSIQVIRGARAGIPGSKLVNRRIFRRLLRQRIGDFDLVHARNDYIAAVVGPVLQSAHIPMLWDCRGDSVAEFEERAGREALPGFIKRARRQIILRERESSARNCSAALFVSRPLASLCAPLLDRKPYEIIPCSAPDDLFYFDPELRRQTREKLGYADTDRVLIYSGGLADYQRVPDMLALFRSLRAANGTAKLLLVTPDVERMRRMCHDIAPSDVQLHAAQIGEINGFLNAADAGFILRAHNDINRAAFPTKFAEYCLAGLPVIMDDAVPDCAALADRWDNRLAPEPQAILAGLDSKIDRMRVMEFARGAVTRSAVMPQYKKIYGIQ